MTPDINTKKKLQRASSSYLLEVVALFAVFVILCSPFIYKKRIAAQEVVVENPDATFTGTLSCKKCHENAYSSWKGSDHDKAMAEATEETVRGDFNDVTFTDPYTGKTSRFFKRDDTFLVETEGPDGEIGEFTITHTFGFYPLQQYLIPFPNGRKQCLSIAWDDKQKKWYRLPPYDVKDHKDWLHWTRGGETWNAMCAECHSTQLQKNFEMKTESYSTNWYEINVGCEACHGPGSKHLEWANQPALTRPTVKDYDLVISPEMSRSQKQIVNCAPCHSRRYQLGDNNHDSKEILDIMVPSLLVEGMYYPDGQILEEDYVYGSFTQSKMYMKDVRCSDCHDPHSLKLHKEKNDLCLQCHRKEDYDTPRHHFHKEMYEGKPSEGHLCVKCHMPGGYYMGIDYRPDHSLRIPRPDLSHKLNTPNSCSTMDCHGDKPLSWVNENYTKWYGESRKPHYGELFAAAHAQKPGIATKLMKLAEDTLSPPIVRATALSLLVNYPHENILPLLTRLLESDEPLLRHGSLKLLDSADEATLLKYVAPKLYDPVRAVRLEAAFLLATIPEERLRKKDRIVREERLQEYREAMEYNADFAAQRYNLGNLERELGDTDKATEYFKAAILIDEQFVPAKVNLAMALNEKGDNEGAEKLLREVVDAHPTMYEVSYSLGLLYSEMNLFEASAKYLGLAADGMPDYSRARYNQGLALLKLKKWQDGADVLRRAVLAEPSNQEYFYTLVNLYFNLRMNSRAKVLADEVLALVPDHIGAQKVLDLMKKQARSGEESH